MPQIFYVNQPISPGHSPNWQLWETDPQSPVLDDNKKDSQTKEEVDNNQCISPLIPSEFLTIEYKNIL